VRLPPPHRAGLNRERTRATAYTAAPRRMIVAPDGRSQAYERNNPDNERTRARTTDAAIIVGRRVVNPRTLAAGRTRSAMPRIIPTSLIRMMTQVAVRTRRTRESAVTGRFMTRAYSSSNVTAWRGR